MTTATQTRKEAYIILCQSTLALDQAKADYKKAPTREHFQAYMKAIDDNGAAGENYEHALLLEEMKMEKVQP
jgi:hypothetical protein